MRVVHFKKESFDIYIGRPSKWGNPYAVGEDGTRSEVIRKYEWWIRKQPHLMNSLHELKGKTLGCWCAPKACHGDVLVKLVKECQMKDVAQNMVSKGILAADESTGTMSKRLATIKAKSNRTNRWKWRDTLLSTPGLENFVSAVILNEETVGQSPAECSEVPIDPCAKDATFPEYLAEKGIIPGVKVDKGAKDAAKFPGELITEGLDGLRSRLEKFRKAGCLFAKWRGVLQAGEDNCISDAVLISNADALARYAALCQESGLIPIVEPEVILTNNRDLATISNWTLKAIKVTFEHLLHHRVNLEEMVLKPNMVMSGYDCEEQAPAEEVSQLTINVLMNSVSSKVPGIAFLSGGQDDELSIEHLNAMNSTIMELPWRLTFSYGRGLQSDAMAAWGGSDDNVELSREVLLARADRVYKASLGQIEV